MRRFVLATIIPVAAFLSAGFVPSAQAADPAPSGYDVAGRTDLAPGLTYSTFHRAAPEQVVHVARLSRDAPFRLRAVLSNEAVAEPPPRLERTSAMCLRVGCVVAVNADFAAVGTDEPVGATVVDGTIARTPVPTHHQAVVNGDGTADAGVLETRVQLVPTDLRPITVDAVNRPRGADHVVLYTRANGPTTATNPHGVELLLDGLDGLPMNTTRTVRLVDLRDGGNAVIPIGGAVLSGHGRGADALRDLWRRVTDRTVSGDAFLRADAPTDVVTSVGGTPVLVRDGRAWVGASEDLFVRGRHPRTIVGWSDSGEILLVVADGRQRGYSLGLSLPEAAQLMIELGAVEALNLDGGGSSTFAVRGGVSNQPSDVLVRRRGADLLVHEPRPGDVTLSHVERPVVTALAIVPRDGSATTEDVGLPAMPALTASGAIHLAAADPGSNPDGALPAAAIVIERDVGRRWAAALAVALLVAVAGATGLALRTAPAHASRADRSAASSM